MTFLQFGAVLEPEYGGTLITSSNGKLWILFLLLVLKFSINFREKSDFFLKDESVLEHFK